jgi:starvation-inducible DNA-binding protein
MDTQQLGPSVVQGMSTGHAPTPARLLQERLHALNDLYLTLKHAHWNLVGPNFIAVHEMLDAQADAVRAMTDDVAERIATLGGVAQGTAGALVAERPWDDYGIGRADTSIHLSALDASYTLVIEGTRDAVTVSGVNEPVTEDLLIGQLRGLEKSQWLIRAHLATATDRPAG